MCRITVPSSCPDRLGLSPSSPLPLRLMLPARGCIASVPPVHYWWDCLSVAATVVHAALAVITTWLPTKEKIVKRVELVSLAVVVVYAFPIETKSQVQLRLIESTEFAIRRVQVLKKVHSVCIGEIHRPPLETELRTNEGLTCNGRGLKT